MHAERTPAPGGRALAILGALCFAAYLPSALSADFLNFDDVRLFGPASELGRAGLAGILDPTATIADAYLPVAHLSLWIDRALFGDAPLGPHLHSLLLHVLVAFLVARLAFRLGWSRVAAVAAAAVFALHPAVCEAVMWVASRKVLLAGLFGVLALSTVARHADGELPPRRAALQAGGLALLAVYANGSAIVLPFLAAVVVLLRTGARGPWARFWPTATIGAVAALAAFHHAALAAAAGTMAPVSAGLGERLAQVPGAFLHYLTATVWPADLNILYPEVATLESFRAHLVAGTVALAAVAGAIAVLARRAPRVAAGLAFWALALLPYNTALPASALAAADRYLYLALPGAALAVAAVPRVGTAIAVLLAVPLGFGAAARAADFESSRAVWEASLEEDPDNAAALFNRAPTLVDPRPFAAPFSGALTVSEEQLAEIEGSLERALEVARYPEHRLRAAQMLSDLARASQRFERAALFAERAAAAADEVPAARPGALAPRLEWHLQAARLWRMQGDVDAAQRHFEIARELAPEHPFVLCFQASLLLAEAADPQGRVAQGDPRAAEAAALLDRAEARAPDLYELHWTRGEWARAQGHLLKAEKCFRDAIEVDPGRPEAWIARVDLFLAREGMAETAVKTAKEGLRVVNSPELRFRLALALSAAGQIDEARAHYEAYLAARPDDVQARAGLAAVLAAIGTQQLYQMQPDALDRLADRIQELDPGNPKPLLMRAVAARSRHRLVDALVLLESLRERIPEDAEVAQLYAETLRDRGWQLKLQENRPDAAFDHFVRFLEVAPPSVPTEAVDNAVLQEWRRQLSDGREALLAGDSASAEQRFRRCRELRPDEAPTTLDYFLGLAIYQGATGADVARLEDALACFERAAAGGDEDGGHRGLAVLYQVKTLLRLDRDDAARACGGAFLADPGTDADADVIARIRDAIGS